MNLNEWITREDLSIKEFANEFGDVVKENFGTHNYKLVVDIISSKLSNKSINNEEPANLRQIEELLHMNQELSDQCDEFERIIHARDREILTLRKMLKEAKSLQKKYEL